MRQILEIEGHVPVPPMMDAAPFYRITYLIKKEMRKHKWIEGEKGRALSWPEARAEWTEAHREQYEKFLLESLSFPNATTPLRERNKSFYRGSRRSNLCRAINATPQKSMTYD